MTDRQGRLTSPSERNRCGNCTACCNIVGVLELDKPPNEECQHCDVGVGCRIYEDRPSSCATFQCMWLCNPWMADNLRPDRSHVVPEGLEDGAGALAMVDPDHPDAWKSEPVAGLLKAFGGRGISVLVTHEAPREDGAGILLLGKGRTANEFWSSVWATALNQVRREANDTGEDLLSILAKHVAERNL